MPRIHMASRSAKLRNVAAVEDGGSGWWTCWPRGRPSSKLKLRSSLALVHKPKALSPKIDAEPPSFVFRTLIIMNRLSDAPLDLAREIFETTAKIHRDTIPSLMLVSREVHSW